MKTRITLLVLLLLLLLLLLLAVVHIEAHEGDEKKKKDTAASQHEHGVNHHEHDDNANNVLARMDEFPSIHPMIVHFAIVLILVAAVLQWLNVAVIKKEISWVITGILFFGVLTAWLASKKFHPHTHGLSPHAQMVLNQHDLWAAWTMYTSAAAWLLQVVGLFIHRWERRQAVGVSVLLTIASISVCIAGHYGVQLVHIEGIGPQGKYLETEAHHH